MSKYSTSKFYSLRCDSTQQDQVMPQKKKQSETEKNTKKTKGKGCMVIETKKRYNTMLQLRLP